MKRACKFLYVTLIFSSILTACSKETVSNNSDMGLETLQPIITAEKEKFKVFR